MGDLRQILVGFDLPLVQVFLLYLVLTPLLSIAVIAPLLESRLLPVRFRDQFLTFTVGDIALAWFATWMTMSNRRSDYQPIATWWVVVVAVVAAAIAIVITRGELNDKGDFAYAKRAVVSPTKLYHNGILYVGYLWLLTMLLTQSYLQGWTWNMLWMAIPLLVWVATMYVDNVFSSDNTKRSRAANAHTGQWQFAWVFIHKHGWAATGVTCQDIAPNE